ncbi:MBL fold metallo-hydrolase [Leptolyngbya sp. AN02str]|uniref:MBL fold metallo-hydrolase n=1 Tax=Leptolyngbya sp. AN02str TaxID=3423363 RepID=UPI003D3215FD
MAKPHLRRSQNVAGDFYVDESCIDCDTCRWMAPEIFYRAGDQSAVHHQPQSSTERLSALQALLACPTASIGTVEKPTDIRAAQQSFPLAIANSVFHCGYHSEASFGAASYLIQRPEGNVLVDSPRFTPPLVKRLEEMGGISLMYLTHRDDVADHQKFHDHFGCDRVLHADEINSSTRNVEHQIQGHNSVPLADDLLVIPVPGHTKGHTVLLYRNCMLFTGDHLAWSSSLQHLYAFRGACWYSWSELITSMEKLANYSFEWVLPGHGKRFHSDRHTMQTQMQQCIAWMRQVA